MEASALFERFENNVDTIARHLKNGVDIRTTPYHISMPLEVRMLCDILHHVGFDYKITQDGFGSFTEFQQQYQQDAKRFSDAIYQILQDKHAYMKTPDGTVLLKEHLIRRLEYFNEIAHSMEVIARWQQLGSPVQYNYPFLTK
ncbi:hypothetical protein TH61_10010 [Rufibacter sp. DG15C]|uniref:hypothetical protein n=1 Tax=Rufibacter sp. DG15C TaxID=1379909 RepID=UPI00078B9529|nr:hypothetical protein [Rufibacter sp. DG15C]AMM51442.1 hypothetical protein TH61_10010 [Rufibacter sp. DG15C]